MKKYNKIGFIFKVIHLKLILAMIPSSFAYNGTTELLWRSTRAKSALQYWLFLVSPRISETGSDLIPRMDYVRPVWGISLEGELLPSVC